MTNTPVTLLSLLSFEPLLCYLRPPQLPGRPRFPPRGLQDVPHRRARWDCQAHL